MKIDEKERKRKKSREVEGGSLDKSKKGIEERVKKKIYNLEKGRGVLSEIDMRGGSADEVQSPLLELRLRAKNSVKRLGKTDTRVF